MSQVLLGTAVVVVVVVVLVGVLLVFERKFIPRGPFRISFTGDDARAFTAAGSGTLLSTLGDEGILLPSACGGAGTCGLCKVRVLEGGGDALPPERALLKRGDVAAGWRLACQLKVRGDLQLALPEHIARARQLTCRVLSVRDVATFIREITLIPPDGERLEFEAGTFVQIHVPAYKQLRFSDFELAPERRETWKKLGLLEVVASNSEPTTRAYSIANPPVESDRIVLNVRIATPPAVPADAPPGVASSYIYGLRPGDEVALSGPFGDFHINDSACEMIYVGGGAGMAPLRSHILHLFNTLHTARKVSYWYGARSKRELFYDDELEALAAAHPNFSFHAALSDAQPEDEWNGDTGFIHDVLRTRYLAEHPAPDQAEYYLCGPPPMVAAMLAMLSELGVGRDQIRFDDFGG